MFVQHDIEALKAKYLCFDCVGEDYLKDEILASGTIAECSYCGTQQESYTIATMSERISEVFNEHYSRTSDQPDSFQAMMMADKEGSYEWERDGEEVVYAIENAAEIPHEAARDIQVILDDENGDFDAAMMGEETEFASESYYEEKASSIAAWHQEWSAFERSLKTEARFFSQTASKLVSVFGAIQTLKTKDGGSPIVDAGPGTALDGIYRARAFQSEAKLVEAMCRPDRDLGSAPAHLSNAGRMNARGISVFYGARAGPVALAEVRPPVGSKTLVGRFEIIRPLRLLDLTALRNIMERGSLFDPDFGKRLERAMFLRYLSTKMTRPVMPDDEAFEYLPTQAIADFLATQMDPPIDGIIFPSVQAADDADLNVVLFHKAARVETYEVAKGTRIEGRTYESHAEGSDDNYSVIEWLPPQEKKKAEPSPGWPDFAGMRISPWIEADPDGREPALRVDMKSLAVHHVDSVKYGTTDFDVSRSQYQHRDVDF